MRGVIGGPFPTLVNCIWPNSFDGRPLVYSFEGRPLYVVAVAGGEGVVYMTAPEVPMVRGGGLRAIELPGRLAAFEAEMVAGGEDEPDDWPPRGRGVAGGEEAYV